MFIISRVFSWALQIVYDNDASSLTDGGSALNYLLFKLGDAANLADDTALVPKIPIIILSKHPHLSFSRKVTTDTLLSYYTKRREQETAGDGSDSSDPSNPSDDSNLSKISTVATSLSRIPKPTIERILTSFEDGDDDVTECFCDGQTSFSCPSTTGRDHCPVFSLVYRAAEEMAAQLPSYDDSEEVNQSKLRQTVCEKVFQFHHPKITVCGFGILSEKCASLFIQSDSLEQNELDSKKTHAVMLLDSLQNQVQAHQSKQK